MAKGPLTRDITKSVLAQPGSRFWRLFTITSSNVTTTAQTLGTSATGRLLIKQVILQTDATGLAGGTNFELAVTNAKGTLKFGVETVANLGANVTKNLVTSAPAADTTTADGGFTVTALQTVLEAGKSITYDMTSSVGTGAGTIDIYIEFECVDKGATYIGGTAIA